MRRRLGRYLPIVLIALMVQIFAPIAACWAATLSASDPLAKALICSPSGAKSGQSDTSGGGPRSGCCSVCCVAQGAVPLDQPDPAAFVVPERRVHRVVWRALDLQSPTLTAGAHAQARAPPTNS